MSDEGFRLLTEGKIKDFNAWRMKNLIVKLNFSDKDLSGRNISGAYLNGIVAEKINFQRANLSGANFVQANLSGANFESADLTDTLMMYTEMKEARLVNANLTRTNLMWANMQGVDLTDSRLLRTVLVEANLQNAQVNGADKGGAYLKHAKLDGCAWFEQVAEKL